MSFLRRIAAAAVFGAVLLIPSTSEAQPCQVAGNVVTNCSFEGPTLGSGAHYPNASVGGWTSSNGTYERWVNNFSGFGARDGISHVELNVNAPTTLWQYINTVAGSTYDLSFSAAHRVNPNVKGSYSQIDVYVDNNFLFSTGPMSTGFSWQDFSTMFTATSTQTKLEFRGMGNGGSYGNHLDNITAVSTTVPEPSTYALMASGLAALAFVSRRKRNRR